MNILTLSDSEITFSCIFPRKSLEYMLQETSTGMLEIVQFTVAKQLEIIQITDDMEKIN